MSYPSSKNITGEFTLQNGLQSRDPKLDASYSWDCTALSQIKKTWKVGLLPQAKSSALLFQAFVLVYLHGIELHSTKTELAKRSLHTLSSYCHPSYECRFLDKPKQQM